MRTSVLVVATLLAFVAVSSAATPTFHHEIDSMYPAEERVDEQGRTHVRHEYHFVHPTHGSFVKKSMQGVLASHKYGFVGLSTESVRKVEFGAAGADGVSEVTLVGASATVRAGLQQQGKNAVLVSVHFSDNEGRHVMHHVRQVVRSEGDVVVVRVAAAQYQDLFQDLEMSYSTNHLPHTETHSAELHGDVDHSQFDGQDVAMPEATGKIAGAARHGAAQGWISSLFKKIVSGVAAIFDFNGLFGRITEDLKALAAQVDISKLIFTGALDIAQPVRLVSFVYNRPQSPAIEKVTQKYFHDAIGIQIGGSVQFDSTLNLALSIQSYKINSASAVIGGNFAAEIVAVVSKDIAYTKATDMRKKLLALSCSPIMFAVGAVPVIITPRFQVFGGASLEINAHAEITLRLSGSGSASFGYQYTGGKLVPTLSRAFEFKPSLGGKLNVNVAFRPYIEPDFGLHINFIGGPYGSFNIAGEAQFQMDGSNAECPIGLTVSLAPTLTVGGKIDISIASKQLISKEIAPTVLYSTKKQLYSKCQTVPLSVTKFFTPTATQYVLDGSDSNSVFSGAVATKACNKEVSMQVVGAFEGQVGFYGSEATIAGDSYIASKQFGYVAKQDQSTLTMVHTENERIDYTSTVDGADAPVIPETLTAELSQDGNTLVLKNYGTCGDVILSRSVPVLADAAAVAAADNSSARGASKVSVGVIGAIAGALVAVIVGAAIVVVVVSRRRVAAQNADVPMTAM